MQNLHPIKCQFNSPIGSSSTFDAESYVDSPFRQWEPVWYMYDPHEKTAGSLCIFCPFCSYQVFLNQPSFVCSDSKGKRCLAHLDCKDDNVNFTDYVLQAQCCPSSPTNLSSDLKIGCKEFLVNLSVEHPLSQQKYISTLQKLYENSQALVYEPGRKPVDLFEPNVLLFPVQDFKICIKIKAISEEQPAFQPLYFWVSLDQNKSGEQAIAIKVNQFKCIVEFQIISDPYQKARTISEMNFKYKYQGGESITKLNRVTILFRDKEIEENSSISPENYNQSVLQNEDNYMSPPNIIQSQEDFSMITFIQQKQQYLQEGSAEDFEFINSLKTQIGSKQFQRNVKGMTPQSIEVVVTKILPFLQEIILDQYANYMFQSLLGACTYYQRIRILKNVNQRLRDLVCQQQGTFVFQQLISYMTHREEFECLGQEAARNFEKLVMDNYGNHFMRKFIQNVPKDMIEMFLPEIEKNFVMFAKNKNAVCVMKSVLRALKGDKNLEEVAFTKKKILGCLTLNTKQLINDEFGNYLIQESFELFKAHSLPGITELIIKLFSKLSCQRYASNVVQNCIKKHWLVSEQFEAYEKIKKNLDNKTIQLMYNSKEGNKVLLEMMDLPFETVLKDKISSGVRNEQASKFNNNRWISIVGKSRTGAVGTSFSNFSEAHQFTKKKHYF